MPVHKLFNITGIKIYETNERDLVMEPAIKWAGNQNITVAIKVLSQRITVQVKLQILHSDIHGLIQNRSLNTYYTCLLSVG